MGGGSTTTLERLAAEIASLCRDVDRLRDDVGRLYGHAEQLGLELHTAAAASAAVSAAASSLRQDITLELHRAGSMRNALFIVDHDATSRAVAADALGSAGFTVRAFPRADEVIDLLRLEVPRAVLIDLALPGMPGPVLAEYMRTNPRTARVCRLGMTAFVPSAHDARPFASLIDKPLSADAVVEFVRRSLERRSTARLRPITER